MDTEERAGPSGGAAGISAADTAPGGRVDKCPFPPERGRRWRLPTTAPPPPTRERRGLRGGRQGEGEGHPDLRVSGCLFRSQRTALGSGLPARRPSESPSFVFGKMERSSSDIRRGSTWAPGWNAWASLRWDTPKPGLQPLWGRIGEMGKDVDG